MHKYNYSIRNSIIEINLIFYVTALLIPMYYILPIPYGTVAGYTVSEIHSVPGSWAFVYGLLSMPYDLQALYHGEVEAACSLIWIPNIAYLYVLYLLRRRKSTTGPYLLTIISIVFILMFNFCHSQVTIGDRQEIFYIGAKSIGYYTWLLSFLTLLCAVIYDSIYKRAENKSRTSRE